MQPEETQEKEPIPAPEETATPPNVTESPKPTPNASGSLIFNDSAFEAAIRDMLGQKTGDVFPADVKALRNLRFIGQFYGAKDWFFINGYSATQYFDENGQVHTESGDIKDVSAISGIYGIETFEISWQNNFNLDSVKNLKVGDLRLLHDNLTDISVLKGMSTLWLLRLDSNDITDVSPLSGLPVSQLTLNNNPITDISPLAKMESLNYLEINGCPITNISALKGVKNLEYLGISGTNVTDISVLKELPKLRTLSMINVKLDSKNEAILKELSTLKIIR